MSNMSTHDSVALSVGRLEDREPTRRRRPRGNQEVCRGYGSIALMVIGISIIFLGILVLVFGTLCTAAGVRYGPTGDTLIKPWRALPLGGIAIVCGAMAMNLTRALKNKPVRRAIVTMLVSVVCGTWAVVVVLSYSFDVSEQWKTYLSLKKETMAAAASRGIFAGYRKDKMNAALRDVIYFAGVVAFSSMTAVTAIVQGVVAGFYVGAPSNERMAYQRSGQRVVHVDGGPMRNAVVTALTKIFVHYKNRAALAIGVMQMVCGSSVVLGLGLALATEHNASWAAYVITHGILYIIAGIVGAVSGRSKARRMVTAAMILSLCAAVAALNMICSDVSFIINSHVHPTSGRSKIDKLSLTPKLFAIHGLDLFVNLIELIVAGVLFGLGCHVICDVARRADDTQCLVSYVEVGQRDRLDMEETDYNMNDRDEFSSSHLPDILHESMTTEEDILGRERPQYMAAAMAHPP